MWAYLLIGAVLGACAMVIVIFLLLALAHKAYGEIDEVPR